MAEGGRPRVGLDLGTTDAVVAVSRKGKVVIIANDSDSRTTPCVVSFMGGESFVGEAARDLPPQSTAYGEFSRVQRPCEDSILALIRGT